KLGVRDKRALITALEARVYDLKLSRTVALQALPSIRLIQDNNKTLVEKINSTIVNTLPLWKNQLAQAVTIYRSKKASESIKAAQDFTNELLEGNAKKLQEANKEVTQQAQRGVFDIESVRKANETLIATINESLDITNAAKVKRAEAEKELLDIERQLHDALVAAEKRKLHS
ncbi:MAG TPA: toxic anion resistance protein, partial [Campylobacterales bacterium]|nr:toxic anion resistance protein [Campylobacterales bacterium]